MARAARGNNRVCLAERRCHWPLGCGVVIIVHYRLCNAQLGIPTGSVGHEQGSWSERLQENVSALDEGSLCHMGCRGDTLPPVACGRTATAAQAFEVPTAGSGCLVSPRLRLRATDELRRKMDSSVSTDNTSEARRHNVGWPKLRVRRVVCGVRDYSRTPACSAASCPFRLSAGR